MQAYFLSSVGKPMDASVGSLEEWLKPAEKTGQ